MVVNKGGSYTKHIYIGLQRIVSKLGDLDSYGQDPRRIEYAGANVDGASVIYKAKYTVSQQAIKNNYAIFFVILYLPIVYAIIIELIALIIISIFYWIKKYKDRK